MPYLLHRSADLDAIAAQVTSHQENDPTYYAITIDDAIAIAFATRAEAYAELAQRKVSDPEAHWIVTFAIANTEKRSWHEREERRFRDATYFPPPWDRDDAIAGIPEYHYCHGSLTHAGLVAYTPDDEMGFSDRQIRLTPAKYLQRFATGLSHDKIQEYCNRLKGYGSTFAIATSAVDIVKVYSLGPDSCMSHSLRSYASDPIHPCTPYGDSDLAVAYLGDLAAGTVKARSVIWPEKKIYTRVYGDHELACALSAAGYTKRDDLDGARIRAIECKGTYVMPYIDAADSADLDGDWFRLGWHGEYSARNQNGLAEVAQRDCDNCGAAYDADEDDSYCQSCRDDRWSCDSCGDDSFDRDDAVAVGDDTLCSHCADNQASTCARCGDSFHEANIGRRERTRRTSENLTNFCEDCGTNYHYCDECDSIVANDEVCCEAETIAETETV